MSKLHPRLPADVVLGLRLRLNLSDEQVAELEEAYDEVYDLLHSMTVAAFRAATEAVYAAIEQRDSS